MNRPVSTRSPDALLVRYGELALKRGNRFEFEQALMRNLRAACSSIEPVRVEREHGRLIVFAERRLESLAQRCAQVFGVTSISPAWVAPAEPEAICRVARGVLDDALAALPQGARPTFRVLTKRADKRFPLTSLELDRFVAERVLREGDPLTIELDRPQLVLGIEVRDGRAWVFARRIHGPGGLPVGTLGRVLCLISGGIDSPVAAWMALKRGCDVRYVTFHARGFIGEPALEKVGELVRVLATWQGSSRLFVVPFAPVQLALKAVTTSTLDEGYRTILYRRMMQRIASRLALREECLALVTGESMGQVASQTLENLACIEAAAELPVLRPLVAFDKQETVEIAQRIGTYALSAVQEPDCCTLFLPRKPVTRGRIESCERIEQRLDLEALIGEALAQVEARELA